MKSLSVKDAVALLMSVSVYAHTVVNLRTANVASASIRRLADSNNSFVSEDSVGEVEW